MRIRFATLFLACFFSLTALHSEEKASPPQLSVSCERPAAIYEKGETVRFLIRLAADGKPAEGSEVKWTVFKNGLIPLDQGTVVLDNGQAAVSARLDEPGFLLCEATYEKDGETLKELAGAGVDPLQIQPGLPPPEDFDAFWSGQLARLSEVPKNFRLTPVESPDPNVEVFDLQVDSPGAPVSGYFARPAKKKARSLPAILTTHGAGVYSARLDVVVKWAGKGMLALDINAHGLPNGKPKDFYENMAAGELKDYRARGRRDRETVYFRDMFLRLVRAIDFLTEQPEWDGRTLVAYGTSQGGAQAMVAAALDERVSFFVAGVPAMCDHTGFLSGRAPGWPRIIPRGAEGKPNDRVLEATRYYDMVHFAGNIKVPGFFTAGFIDKTCPPATVYAAYNNLSADKAIYDDVTAGHTNTPEAIKRMEQAILKHVSSKQ